VTDAVLQCEDSMASPLYDLPGIHFCLEAHLVTWHPAGVFDNALADRVVEFIESEESLGGEPFDRFADFSALTEIRLTYSHISETAVRRRAGYVGKARVKSAFYCEDAFGFGIAQTYEALMEGGPFKVRAFRARQDAAAWLGVALELLLPKE
jgi:hypothetical protein